MNKHYLKLGSLVLGALSMFGCRIPPIKLKIAKPQSHAQQISDIDKTLIKHNDPRKVDLEILVDKSFMDKHKESWWSDFSKNFQFVDDKFNQKFGIDFDVDSVQYFKFPKDCPNDLYFMLTYMRVKHKPGKYDSFALVSDKKFGNKMGICWCLGNHLIVTSDKEFPLKRVLQHEFSHLFDAVDVKYIKSVMSGYPDCYEWNKENIRIIKNNQYRSWDSMDGWYFDNIRNIITDFSKEDKEDVTKLFCYQFVDTFHMGSIPLAKKLLKKYPDRPFIKLCYESILEKK